MQVRNEENRYLKEVLEDLSQYVDDIVVVDDGSTDNTVRICESFPKVREVFCLTQSHFHKEWELRNILWREGTKHNPDWVLAIDADEIFEKKFHEEVSSLINQDEYDWVAFRLFDFWGSKDFYREDELWNLHKKHSLMLVRYLPSFPYYYLQLEHHAHRLPLSYRALPGYCSDIRVKHYGWAGSEEERFQKYERYMKIDPNGKWGSLAHYQSILDKHPNLVRWKEDVHS